MKILLLGKNGQVGWELQRSLSPLGELVSLGSAECDLADLDGIAGAVRKIAPDVIVNAAAYTAVDKAESEPELARLINAQAPAVLAQAAKQLDAWLVHYSTDYVFDGGGDKPWIEADQTGPLNVYGETKLDGEKQILQSDCKHLIFRTSWVCGARGGNFARTMLRLATERDVLRVIDDQVGAPTGADLLADVTSHAIREARRRPEVSGLYHVAAGGETSWHGYASFVLDCARSLGVALKASEICAVPTSAFPTPALRPHNSRLNTEKLQSTFDLYPPHWKAGVERMLIEVLEKQHD